MWWVAWVYACEVHSNKSSARTTWNGIYSWNDLKQPLAITCIACEGRKKTLCIPLAVSYSLSVPVLHYECCLCIKVRGTEITDHKTHHISSTKHFALNFFRKIYYSLGMCCSGDYLASSLCCLPRAHSNVLRFLWFKVLISTHGRYEDTLPQCHHFVWSVRRCLCVFCWFVSCNVQLHIILMEVCNIFELLVV